MSESMTYINPSLTKAQAAAAYKARCQRRLVRAARNNSNNNNSNNQHQNHFSSSHDLGQSAPASSSYHVHPDASKSWLNGPPTVLTVNANSLAKSNAVDVLTTEVLDNNVDIYAISETWFTKHIPDSCVDINGYSLIRKDRSKRKGGGVCFYIRNVIYFFEECAFPSFNSCVKILWIRVTYNSSPYFIACCYFLPNPRHTADDFVRQLQSDLDSIMCNSDCCTVIVTGDFNRLDTSFL